MTSSDVAPALGQEPVEMAKPDDGDIEMWSVTTIIDVLNKPALLYWAAQRAADAAVAQADILGSRIANEGKGPVAKWLRDARFRPDRFRLTEAGLGRVVHAACESYALTGVRPSFDDLCSMVAAEANDEAFEGVVPEAEMTSTMLDRFDEWASEFQPAYIATEVVVYNLTYGYAGQSDAFLRLNGTGPLIGDYKTTREPRDSQNRPKTPYPEAALQLAAYRYAERAAVWRPRRTKRYQRRVYLLSDAERDHAVPVPEVGGGVVIHITPEACQAFPIRCDEEVFTSYLYVQEAARWVYDISKDVIGLPLAVP